MEQGTGVMQKDGGNWFWDLLRLPPVGHETALHIDLATAFIALLALVFSIWTWWHQEKMSIAAMRMERDNGLIGWINGVIDTIVELEFVLRNWSAPTDEKDVAAKAKLYLPRLSRAIDQGRLYFPDFPLDAIPGQRTEGSLGDGPPILDHLVKIYDLVKKLDASTKPSVQTAREQLLAMKRRFISDAQAEVEPGRRLLFNRKRKKRKRP